MNRLKTLVISLCLPWGLCLPWASAAAAPDGPLSGFLVLPPLVEYDKSPVHRDPIDAAIASGAWRTPRAGDTVAAADGSTATWRRAQAGGGGGLADRQAVGGYAYATVASPEDRVVLLRATRHASVRVNDAWLAGDPYGLGFVELPVRLRQGENHFLFHVARPGMRAELVTPESDVKLLTADAVLPNVVRGEGGEFWGAVPIVNARAEPLVGARVATKVGDNKPTVIDLPRIEPLTVYKCKFRFTAPVDPTGDQLELRVAVVKSTTASQVSADAEPGENADRADRGAIEEADGEAPADGERASDQPASDKRPPDVGSPEGGSLAEPPAGDAPPTEPPPREEIEVLARALLGLRVVEPGALADRTFVSQADGSVQRYAVLPASEKSAAAGLVVTLHDFGVDCRDHLAAYQAKAWAHLVAPQGRRRHGFDWEDWGAADALEALENAKRLYPVDARRVSLTGVGAGGHGAWLLGAMHADRFAAVGPVDGWLSYWSRGAGMPSYPDPKPTEAVLARSAAGSDTLAVLRNLAGPGVYLLHDAADRYVAQSRFARRRLADFHPDFVYLERPAASAAEADWPGLMEYLRRHQSPMPGDVDTVDFTTVDPGRSSRSAWASIEAQEQPLEPSRVVIDQEQPSRSFSGRTENVARLSLDIGHLPRDGRRPIRVRLDDSPVIEMERPSRRRGQASLRLWLAKDDDGRWRQARPTRSGKTARRSGNFKSVFGGNTLLVYGTAGDEQENRWAEAKARYDAQTFWVRGNGSLDVVPDTAFNPLTGVNRSVVLYGNADTNRAWPALLSTSPVQARRGQVYVGVRPELGGDVGLLMVRPRRGSRTALVGVVGGSGLAGMRLTNRLRYFFAGIGYPDLTLIGPRGPVEGAVGVRAVGSFGPDWSLERGDIAWRDLAI